MILFGETNIMPIDELTIVLKVPDIILSWIIMISMKIARIIMDGVLLGRLNIGLEKFG